MACNSVVEGGGDYYLREGFRKPTIEKNVKNRKEMQFRRPIEHKPLVTKNIVVITPPKITIT